MASGRMRGNRDGCGRSLGEWAGFKRGKVVLAITRIAIWNNSEETIEPLRGLKIFRDACLGNALRKRLSGKTSPKKPTGEDLT